jgi:hypothetical protein
VSETRTPSVGSPGRPGAFACWQATPATLVTFPRSMGAASYSAPRDRPSNPGPGSQQSVAQATTPGLRCRRGRSACRGRCCRGCRRARAAARVLGIRIRGCALPGIGSASRSGHRPGAGGPRLVGDRVGVSSTPEPARSLPPTAGTKKSAPVQHPIPIRRPPRPSSWRTRPRSRPVRPASGLRRLAGLLPRAVDMSWPRAAARTGVERKAARRTCPICHEVAECRLAARGCHDWYG